MLIVTLARMPQRSSPTPQRSYLYTTQLVRKGRWREGGRDGGRWREGGRDGERKRADRVERAW